MNRLNSTGNGPGSRFFESDNLEVSDDELLLPESVVLLDGFLPRCTIRDELLRSEVRASREGKESTRLLGQTKGTKEDGDIGGMVEGDDDWGGMVRRRRRRDGSDTAALDGLVTTGVGD